MRGGGGMAAEQGGGRGCSIFFIAAVFCIYAILTMLDAPTKDPALVRRRCKCRFCTDLRNAAAQKAFARARRVKGGVEVRPVLVLHAVGEKYIKTCRDCCDSDLLCASALRSRRPRSDLV